MRCVHAAVNCGDARNQTNNIGCLQREILQVCAACMAWCDSVNVGVPWDL
jgi:hypothetical protein